MASATRQLRSTSQPINLTTMLLTGAGNLRRAPVREFCSTRQLDIPGRVYTRRYCSSSSAAPRSLTEADETRRLMPELSVDVTPSVVALLTCFSPSKSREIPHCACRATGVFVDPKLIATSARVVGRISTFYDSERGAILHDCFIGRTIALTNHRKVLRMTPVAVNFAGDVAVLEVVNPEGDLPPPCSVANVFADKESPLLGISRQENFTEIICLPEAGYRRAPKAPWPLDDELGWVDYGAACKNGGLGFPATDISGSPWFNFRREVVGIASWTAEAGDDGFVSSYAVPPLRIRSMIDYANTKDPDDPIVMDRWINAHTLPDHDSHAVEECIPDWPMSVLTHWVSR